MRWHEGWFNRLTASNFGDIKLAHDIHYDVLPFLTRIVLYAYLRSYLQVICSYMHISNLVLITQLIYIG